MKVGVCGGITFQDRDWLHAGLDLLHSTKPIEMIIEGGRPGVDVRAQEWAYKREIPCLTIPIRYHQHGADAPVIHFGEQLKQKPDVVLVTPCADKRFIEIATAHGAKVVRLEKMPVAKTPGR